MNPEALELFSGFGGVEIALESMGYKVAAAVERERKPAEVYQRNHPGTPVHIASVADVDYRPFYGIDLLHGSPPCQNFSKARDPNLPPHADADAGLEMIRAAAECRPRLITLENVPGYLRSGIFREICTGLAGLGYVAIVHPTTQDHHVYSWDKLGGPQSRRRLLARWVHQDHLDDLPYDASDRTLFGVGKCWGWALEPIARPTAGWYAAIADLLAVMPDGKLAPWQERALIKGGWISEDGHLLVGKMQHGTRGVVAAVADDPSFTVTAGMHGTKALLVGRTFNQGSGQIKCQVDCLPAYTITDKQGGSNYKALLIHPTDQRTCPIAPSGLPAPTVTCNSSGNLHKALLLPRVSGRTDDNGALKNVRTADSPAPTVKALGHDQHYRQFDAMLSDASVKCLDTRCLARLQGFPDWFELPEVAYVAGKGIGNAVPPPMYEAIAGPLLRAINKIEVAA